MLVAAITSTAVLAIFQIARYETLETESRSHMAQARWTAIGAKELAVARLLANSEFRGEFNVEITPGSGQWANVQVAGDDRWLTITASGSVQGMRQTIQSSFSLQQLKDRASLPSQAAPTAVPTFEVPLP